MAVAQGQQPADTVIRRSNVVNVFTGEVLQNQTIAIRHGRVAYVGDEPPDFVGATTEVVDADGQTAAPGFIDAHTHIFSSRYSVPEFIRFAAVGGTTLVITETIEMASIAGGAGLEASLEAIRDQPIKILATLPPLAALAPFMETQAPTIDEYRALLARPEVVGLGETYWGNLVRGDARLDALIELTLEAGKVAEGHTAGSRGAKLQAYACAGISSCHEPITAEEGLARLRLGMHFMIRDGEIRQDLEVIAPIWNDSVDTRRMILVTDGVGAERLLERGYLEQNVRRAIELGLDPIKAIQMATINPAEHFKLDLHVGAIAPGRCADLILLPDVRTIRPALVLSDGQVVAREGQVVASPRTPTFPSALRQTVRLAGLPTARDFVIPAPPWTSGRARIIEYVTGLVTRESELEITSRDGESEPVDSTDVAKVAAIDRFRGTNERFVGWARGYGIRAGAVATSMSWDARCILVLGRSDADMAAAVERLREIGGGAVVCVGGRVAAEMAAPVGGIISELPMEELAEQLRTIRLTLGDLGCPWPDPLLAVDVLTTAAIPFFRITEHGYVRVRDGTMVPLWIT